MDGFVRVIEIDLTVGCVVCRLSAATDIGSSLLCGGTLKHPVGEPMQQDGRMQCAVVQYSVLVYCAAP